MGRPTSPQGSILFVDAYDSFSENIAALLRQLLQVELTLIKNDCDIAQRFNKSSHEFFSSFDAIVLGPGPGNPYDARDVGLYNDVWRIAVDASIPVLGICLGFQSLCVQYGVPVTRMDLPCHGHAKTVYHTSGSIFSGSGQVTATCYNSFGVWQEHTTKLVSSSRSSSAGSNGSRRSKNSDGSSVSTTSLNGPSAMRSRSPNDLETIAQDADGWIMAVRHKSHPFHGLQFHPESCRSDSACHRVIENWWLSAMAHNKTHSRYCHVDIKNSDQPLEHPTCSAATAAFQSELQSLTGQCGGSGASKTVALEGSAGHIADLCIRLSPDNKVAMLESTKKGRYSIYAFPHSSTFLLELQNDHVSIECGGSLTTFQLGPEDVINAVEALVTSKSFVAPDSHVPFRGGFMGFLSYEFGLRNLKLDFPKLTSSGSNIPEMSLLWVERSVIVDHQTGTVRVQTIRHDDNMWIESIVLALSEDSDTAVSPEGQLEALSSVLSTTQFGLPDHDNYVSQIRACKAELHAGNSYELCLTTEATVTTTTSPSTPYALYKNIQRHNPVPYAAYLSLNTTKILSSSPEHFLSWSAPSGSIDMIPMKGTVKRSPDMTLQKATEILSSAKESAENLMIADLIRHDLYSALGRDAKVEVVKLCDVVESETVYSLVSHIRAHVPVQSEMDEKSKEYVREINQHGIKALTTTLPPGSMTGAPKKRSCEILQGLEKRDRGVYSGAIGYIDVCGNGAWSVCIRSAFSSDKDNVVNEETGEEKRRWRVGAGGAITVLSDEEAEWEEMRTKMDSVLRGFRKDR